MSPAHARPIVRPVRATLLGLACGAWFTLAQAGVVEAYFPDPRAMSDVRDANGFNADVEKPLGDYLRTLGDKLLGDRRLVINVVDVDLAGQLEPVGPRQEMIRVLRSHTWPRIELRYQLSDANGVGLRSGEVRLIDTDYLSNARLAGGTDPLRYEKQMLKDWFMREFTER
ncbi:MAG TPA: DUF3016 domain-containing protein [Ideonella sp.]|uniref:DUF3016 domain-containing protein n=1 Tax=Ideonella sp. TaxID=1929293 RepID=UPI002CDE7403|nr:DUF3016 domain-containing protein [Ideonella sp.]HSI49331.1 DUF3016 domain-containing protein [Ideonella sp.]